MNNNFNYCPNCAGRNVNNSGNRNGFVLNAVIFCTTMLQLL